MPLARFILILVLCLSSATASSEAVPPAAPVEGVPLVVGNRTIHAFRVPLGMFTAEERAESAARRIEAAFQQSGEGWTSIRPDEQGFLVELDGQPLFYVLAGDANGAAGETPERLANQASRLLQKAWSESRERVDSKARLLPARDLG